MIVGIGWAIAAVVALVVALFCAYEIRWKLARSRADLSELDHLVVALGELQAELRGVALRLAQTRSTT